MPKERESIQLLSEPRDVSMANDWYQFATDDHFWIQWRFRVLLKNKDLLPDDGSQVLDIGCGHGTFLRQLTAHTNLKTNGCDLNLQALEMAASSDANLFVYDILEQSPSLRQMYSTVFLMDVIEHIDDDETFLRAAAYHAKPNGLIVINVPCGNWLYGRYDKVAGHKRRYDASSIKSLFQLAGIECLRIVHWGFSMVPLVIMRNCVLPFQKEEEVIRTGFQPPTRGVSYFLQTLMKCELALPVNVPWGTSILVFGRVPETR